MCLSTADFLEEKASLATLGRKPCELVVVMCSLTLARSMACCSRCLGQNLQKNTSSRVAERTGPRQIKNTLFSGNLRFPDQIVNWVRNFIHEKRSAIRGLQIRYENAACRRREQQRRWATRSGKISQKEEPDLNNYRTSFVAKAQVTWKAFEQFLCEHCMHAPNDAAYMSAI